MTITVNITIKRGEEIVAYLMRTNKITAAQAVTALLNQGLTVVRDMDQDFDKLCERIEREQQ